MQGTGSGKSWTLLELLNWTTRYFQQSGIENPRLNAEMLLAKVLAVERIMLYARFDQEPDTGRLVEFRELVKRRHERCPVQYLLGRCEFYSRDFEVTPAVLVPRPETELLVDKCLEVLPGDCAGLTAADIGTGSGAIAVTLACERPGLRLCATDSSPDALRVAARNAGRNGVADRVLPAEGDLCDALPDGFRAGLALLAGNPPYVPTGRIADLQPEVRDYEPRRALDGGPDGLTVIRRLLPQAAQAVAGGGWIVLEIGEDQADEVRAIIGGIGLLDASSMETTRDGGGCERVLAVRRRAT